MTKAELDERINNLGGSLEDKIDYIDDWLFQIDMIDKWTREDYQMSSLLHQKKLELLRLRDNG